MTKPRKTRTFLADWQGYVVSFATVGDRKDFIALHPDAAIITRKDALAKYGSVTDGYTGIAHALRANGFGVLDVRKGRL